MRITSVNTYPVEIPLIPLEEGGLGPFISGFHRVENARSIIVKVGTDEGIVGWGEMKDVFLSPRVMKSIVEEKLLPKIVGKDPFDILSIIKDLSFTVSSQYFTGSFFACGIEVACWDIVGKIIDKPIYKLLGGRFRDRIPICHVSGMMSVDKTAEKAKQAVDKGYQTFKTKAGRDVIDDIARVKAIRQAVGSEVEVRVDPNQLYTMVEALHFLKEVEECNLEFIEQPIRINSFSDLASLRNRTRTPIAVNEDCYLQHNLFEAIKAEAIDVACPEIETLGGISGFQEISHVAKQANLPLASHHSFDLGIKTAAILQATSALPSFTLAMDSTYYAHSDYILRSPLQIKDGCFIVPDSPGLGIDVDEKQLEKYGISS